MRATSVVRRSFSSMTSFSASAIFPAVPVNSTGIRAEKSPFLNAVRVRSSRRSKSFGANSLALLMPIPVVIARCPFARPNRIEIVQMRLRRCWVRYATREPAPWQCGALAPPSKKRRQAAALLRRIRGGRRRRAGVRRLRWSAGVRRRLRLRRCLDDFGGRSGAHSTASRSRH